MNGFITGFNYAFKGIGLLNQKGIRPFVLMPLLINCLLFVGALWLGIHQFDIWMDKLTHWLPSWLSFLEGFFWVVFMLFFCAIIFYGFTTLANLVAAPFNSLLSERLEQKLEGLPLPPFRGYRAIVGTIARTLWSEVRKIIYSIKLVIILIILSFIPVIQIFSPLFWGIFSVWMLVIEYTDYPMGNHELLFKEEKRRLKQYRGMSLGLGSGIFVLNLIPVVNLFAMPAGVAGGTLFWVNQLSRNHE